MQVGRGLGLGGGGSRGQRCSQCCEHVETSASQTKTTTYQLLVASYCAEWLPIHLILTLSSTRLLLTRATHCWSCVNTATINLTRCVELNTRPSCCCTTCTTLTTPTFERCVRTVPSPSLRCAGTARCVPTSTTAPRATRHRLRRLQLSLLLYRNCMNTLSRHSESHVCKLNGIELNCKRCGGGARGEDMDIYKQPKCVQDWDDQVT